MAVLELVVAVVEHPAVRARTRELALERTVVPPVVEDVREAPALSPRVLAHRLPLVLSCRWRRDDGPALLNQVWPDDLARLLRLRVVRLVEQRVVSRSGGSGLLDRLVVVS